MIFAAGSAGLAVIGVIGLTRRPRPARRPDRISLIELAAASLDPEFAPLPEQPWEGKLDRLLCWIAVLAGIVFFLIGLNF
jgi:hypothetical protein